MCDDEVHNKMHPNTTMAYQQGIQGNRVLFVFESPGRFEHELQRPAVGETGVHLCMLCERLRALAANSQNESLRDIGKDFCKVGASIINIASDWLPEIKSDTKSGTYKNSYQLTTDERKAILRQLKQRAEFGSLMRRADVIICFGRLAWDMLETIKEKRAMVKRGFCIITTYHLSGRATKFFDGNTWPQKMDNQAQKIYEVLQEWVNGTDTKIVFDFTNFKKSHKKIDVD